MRLGLGTVQFGTNYGVSNRLGKPSDQEIIEILSFAKEKGVSFLDTAPVYGDAEALIGKLSPEPFQIVTKTKKSKDVREVEEEFFLSLDRLRQKNLYGLLVHDAKDLSGELISWLNEIKTQGLVKKIGISIYSPADLENISDSFFPDIVQLPVNVLDQRSLNQGTLRELKAKGIEIHARSAFLQGLLLMKPGEIPAHLKSLYPLLSQYQSECSALGLSPLQAALGFLKSIKQIDCVLVGVAVCQELQEIIQAWEESMFRLPDYGQYACSNEIFLNPSLWSNHA